MKTAQYPTPTYRRLRHITCPRPYSLLYSLSSIFDSLYYFSFYILYSTSTSLPLYIFYTLLYSGQYQTLDSSGAVTPNPLRFAFLLSPPTPSGLSLLALFSWSVQFLDSQLYSTSLSLLYISFSFLHPLLSEPPFYLSPLFPLSRNELAPARSHSPATPPIPWKKTQWTASTSQKPSSIKESKWQAWLPLPPMAMAGRNEEREPT